ncbi:MAG: hypothetical protein P1R58_07260 [bacterium]|nr:hypothetical protein [bacterium]
MLTKIKSEAGMSLIELTAIIIVVGILTSMAMQSMTVLVEDVRQVGTERELEELSVAIVGDPDITQNGLRADFGYVGDIGSFPPNLSALQNNPGGFATWAGPYTKPGLNQDTLGYKTDEWGSAYNYSGGLSITSTGSGTTITRKVADASSDYLLNHLNGTIRDANDSLPGAIYRDSVQIKITVPNGAGGTVTKQYAPNAAGAFTLDSLPVGIHSLDLIYVPDNDTLHRFQTILPRHKSAVSYAFADGYFSGGGGGPTSSSEILYPVGVGTSSQLLDENCAVNWQCVDEVTADDNSTFVKGEGSGWNRDSYDTQNSTVSTGTIDSVVVYMVVVGSGGGKKASTSLDVSGSYYDGSEINLTSVSSYTTYSTTYAVNPNTSSEWSWTDIDVLQVGVQLKKEAKCTQVYAEVFYTN